MPAQAMRPMRLTVVPRGARVDEHRPRGTQELQAAGDHRRRALRRAGGRRPARRCLSKEACALGPPFGDARPRMPTRLSDVCQHHVYRIGAASTNCDRPRASPPEIGTAALRPFLKRTARACAFKSSPKQHGQWWFTAGPRAAPTDSLVSASGSYAAAEATAKKRLIASRHLRRAQPAGAGSRGSWPAQREPRRGPAFGGSSRTVG